MLCAHPVQPKLPRKKKKKKKAEEFTAQHCKYGVPECRFEVWPYLERFAEDATKAVKAELHKAGHGDGNLVASLMSHALGVTQCNIAHALEKTKYNDADINWCVTPWSLHVTRFATQYMVVLDHHNHIMLPWLLHSTMDVL